MKKKENIGLNRLKCPVSSIFKKLMYMLVYSDYLRREGIRRTWNREKTDSLLVKGNGKMFFNDHFTYVWHSIMTISKM